ncbi:polyprenyl synthetase family protein [Streptomyces sp. 4503]|uniref:Polyprenyl synthetase family protein n=1 Tax=Streptomyces niphimycinicus TaxID=2842201 RepID=A0ABS6CUP3_9ACTN|nr:polyprenyl synthetase family protein [Streptomyces niphimycinicus]MBU3870604.1 polyprenyl synthetase family protein [Streptomyces niphimycinicus]
MTTPTLSPGRLDADTVRKSVDVVLEDFLTAKAHTTPQHHLPYLSGLLKDFLSGGKRIRPLLCVTGWQAVGGGEDTDTVFRVAACLEMFHAFALIHDDVMDDSDTRRGRPTIHRTLAALCAADRRPDQIERFGVSGAVLLGDLALTWSDELLHSAGLTPAQFEAVLPLLSEMRTEVMLGQYLDLQATGELTDDVEATLTVNRYKTAKYTIERPLHVGAAIAGAAPEAMEAFTAYALPLGEAFQLRDDLLGVYGDPESTGKSQLDDLRAGKNTTLIALALRASDSAQAARLRSLIGNPLLDESDAVTIQEIFAATTAREAVEQMIDDRRTQALRALDDAPFTADAVNALKLIARMATVRNS